MKDPDIAPMNRADMADEIMLLRAQVKVLQNSLAMQEQDQDDYELARLRESHHNLLEEIDLLKKKNQLQDREISFLDQELGWQRTRAAAASNQLALKSCG